MARKGTSRSVFDDQEDANKFSTKLHHFKLQQAMTDANNTFNERIEHLATDMRQSEARTRDYLDAKLDV